MNTQINKFSSLSQAGKSKDSDDVRRRDQFLVRPAMIKIESGFNVRGVGFTNPNEYWKQPHIIEYIDGLANAYANGDYVPPIVIKYNPESGECIVRDGEHRARALQQAIANGADIQFVYVSEFKGDDAKQVLLMLNSGNSLKLNPVEAAESVARLHAFGYEKAEIAKLMNRSITHVNTLLEVYELPISVKRQIQLGQTNVSRALSGAPSKVTEAKFKTPPKKTVVELMEFASSAKTEIVGDVVKVDIPLDLWEKFITKKLDDPDKDQNTFDFV